MKWTRFLQSLVAGVGAALIGSAVQAAELTIATGDGGRYPEVLRQQLDRFEAKTGNKVNIVSTPVSGTETFALFRLWLAARNSDVDVYLLSDEWVPQLANHFVDLGKAAAGKIDQHFPSLIEGQTIGGRLVGMPLFADAPALLPRRPAEEVWKARAKHLGRASGDGEGGYRRRAGRRQYEPLGLRLSGRRL
jgi:trehalose/maltose transport system substrate-binding protein